MGNEWFEMEGVFCETVVLLGMTTFEGFALGKCGCLSRSLPCKELSRYQRKTLI